MKNLFKLSDLSTQDIIKLLNKAQNCKDGMYDNSCMNKIILNYFLEPSTRTHYSFNTAGFKLGCKIMDFNHQHSSILKGESFYDTIKTFDSMDINVIIVRSSDNDYFKELTNIKTPIINAGDGTGNHPTQSLLDLLTIKENFQDFQNLKIAIVGDVKHSRVAHTNIEVMQRLGMDTYTSGPEEFKEDGYKYIDFDEAIKEMDIIMLLRIQNERHDLNLDKKEYHEKFGLTMQRVKSMKENSIIMHPGPFNRGVEIADEVVESSKSRIFNQIQNGVYARMAVLHTLINKGKI